MCKLASIATERRAVLALRCQRWKSLRKRTDGRPAHRWFPGWSSVAVGLVVSGLAWAGAPPLGVNVLRAAVKWRPNYVTTDMLRNAGKDAGNWLNYGKGYSGTRFSQLRQINVHNVKNLVPVWNLSFGVIGAQDSEAVAVNGVLYVTSSQDRVFAIDGATGDILWKYERPLPGDIGARLCCEAVNRGVAVYENMVFLETLDTHVVALSAWDGHVIWDKKLGDYQTGDMYTSMPVVVNGKVIVGNSGSDVGGNVGKITALDAKTGAVDWTTYTRPVSASDPNAKTWGNGSWEHGGVTAWQPGTYDAKRNILYWGTGNPTPDFNPAMRPGDNLYSDSTLAMDPDTGKILFYFQYTPRNYWDYDGNNQNVLITDKSGRNVWLHGDRNGFLYSINRYTGKCNWVVPIAQVNWVKKFGPNCRPEVNPAKVPRVGVVVKDIKPILDGGEEWHPPAYSPLTGLIYVPYIDGSMNIEARDEKWESGQWYLASDVLEANAYSGGLKAFNATTGELVWTHPQSTPATSGVLATAGGLVFSGDAEGYFKAMRADDGATLWRFQVGTGIHGNPSTFTVGDTQYVAIVYGPGGGSLWPLEYAQFMKNHDRGGGMMVFAVKH